VAEPPAGIPNRSFFKPSEVCEIAQIQTYVLRSWESEFPNLGVSRGPGAARVYRRTDVEQVLRIKQLVFDEGLTLAGARRRIEGEPGAAEPETLEELIGDGVRARLTKVREGLRSLLDLLSADAVGVRPAEPAAPRQGAERHDEDAEGFDQPMLFGEEASAVDVTEKPAAPRRRRSHGARSARPADEAPNG
jgi:DNA-binding transcriptional MerR regulator